MQDLMVTSVEQEEDQPPMAAAPPAQEPPVFSSLWIILILIAVAVLLISLWRRRPRGLVIRDPKLGFLNLLGEEGDPLLAEDRPALVPLFTAVKESRDLPAPVCDVLVVYCDLARDGSIFATEIGLRQLIRRSRARILIVASENRSESCLTATQEAGHSGANLVLTMARNGAEFPELLARMFAEMKSGTPMPEAYNKAAPRGKIFVVDAGDLVFSPSPPAPLPQAGEG